MEASRSDETAQSLEDNKPKDNGGGWSVTPVLPKSPHPEAAIGKAAGACTSPAGGDLCKPWPGELTHLPKGAPTPAPGRFSLLPTQAASVDPRPGLVCLQSRPRPPAGQRPGHQGSLQG